MLRRTNISWDDTDAVVDEWMRAHAVNRSAAIRELIRAAVAAQAAQAATPRGGLSEEDRVALIDRIVAEVMARLGSARPVTTIPVSSQGGDAPEIDPARQEELRRRAARTAGRFLT